MTDKGFNLFDEWAAICVHLSPQEEERTIYLLFKIVINLKIFENPLENAYDVESPSRDFPLNNSAIIIN